jgi:hypothetical protein
MPGDLVTVDAHADVDTRGMSGHATIVCSRRPVRIVDDPEPHPKIPMDPARCRPRVHPKRFTGASLS